MRHTKKQKRRFVTSGFIPVGTGPKIKTSDVLKTFLRRLLFDVPYPLGRRFMTCCFIKQVVIEMAGFFLLLADCHIRYETVIILMTELFAYNLSCLCYMSSLLVSHIDEGETTLLQIIIWFLLPHVTNLFFFIDLLTL